MRRRDVERQVRYESRQSGCLALGKLQDKPRQGRGVDDRMLEGTLQAAADQPRVERVVAVLDQHRAVGEAQKRAPRIAELRRADEHRAVNVMAAVRIWVDGRLAVHERVKKRERSMQLEALGSHLEHEEGRVARRLHVQRDELRLIEPRLAPDLGSVDRDLFPSDRFHGPSGF
jgi:hypothetical protein